MSEKIYLQVMSQLNGGREYFYPVNEVAASFCKILNQKTLTKENLEDIENLLGFRVSIMGRKNIVKEPDLKPLEGEAWDTFRSSRSSSPHGEAVREYFKSDEVSDEISKK